tara:strand:- start:739 stop:1194 length:456 start_codon:yes stop_codon:yes gene_type:complete
MAYFAELNSSSVVLQIVVISNEDVTAHGGDESTAAEDFVESLVPFSSGGDSWKQTSYNNSFRKQYAGIGFTYDAAKDKFISLKPYTSWTLNSSDDWVAPVTFPNDTEIGDLSVFITWDEDNLRWIGSTFTSPNAGETKYRWDASALNWVSL